MGDRRVRMEGGGEEERRRGKAKKGDMFVRDEESQGEGESKETEGEE